jgi:2-dehydro-3-deoxyphosphogluconate aldolase/(4S)-4-hydroxy-2-oxoglutarate aldolase
MIENNVFKKNQKEWLYQTGVIAVLVIDDVQDAVPLANALIDGGINFMELTLRTPAAMDALVEIKHHIPEMICGVGTVLKVDQIEKIAAIGAEFAVAPGLNPNIIKRARELGLPFFPGIVTPSDIECAVELNCTILKYFPAEPSGGLSYLKSMSNPYTHLNLKYIPLGGLTHNNFGEYLKYSAVLAVGGSWIASRELILSKNWKKITENAKNAKTVVKTIRGE